MTTPHPRRAQVTGNRYNPNLPADAIWAMREAPGHKRSPYANPHPVGDEGPKPKPCKEPACDGAVHTREEALRLYEERLDINPRIVDRAAVEPAGSTLACRCPLDLPCHVDVLLRRVDALLPATP